LKGLTKRPRWDPKRKPSERKRETVKKRRALGKVGKAVRVGPGGLGGTERKKKKGGKTKGD
jgi:hypothetical protein